MFFGWIFGLKLMPRISQIFIYATSFFSIMGRKDHTSRVNKGSIIGYLNILAILLLASILIISCGCKPSQSSGSSGSGGNDVVVAGSSGSSGGSSGTVSETEFKITGMDWESTRCQLRENECEERKNQKSFSSACVRLLYEATEPVMCHLYINEKLRIDDPLNPELSNVGRIYKFSPNVKVSELADDRFLFFYDTRIRWCCVAQDNPTGLRDKEYDFCKEMELTKLCE